MNQVFNTSLFRGKVALVTGGATGIGYAIASQFLSLSSQVIIASRKEDALREAARTLNAKYGGESGGSGVVEPCSYLTCNIREEEQVVRLFERAIETHGKVDYVVNNGGGQFPAPAQTISKKGWRAVVETNLTGTFMMCREAHEAGRMR